MCVDPGDFFAKNEVEIVSEVSIYMKFYVWHGV